MEVENDMVRSAVKSPPPERMPPESICLLFNTYPGFVHVSVLPENVKPVPPKVVVWSLPVVSAERRVLVAIWNMVDD